MSPVIKIWAFFGGGECGSLGDLEGAEPLHFLRASKRGFAPLLQRRGGDYGGEVYGIKRTKKGSEDSNPRPLSNIPLVIY